MGRSQLFKTGISYSKTKLPQSTCVIACGTKLEKFPNDSCSLLCTPEIQHKGLKPQENRLQKEAFLKKYPRFHVQTEQLQKQLWFT